MGRQLFGALMLWLVLQPASAADDQSALRAREAGAALARGNVDQAIALYTEALADKTLPNERRAVILTDRGVAHARRQSPKDAIEDFNRAIQLYPEYAAVYNNRGTVLLGVGAVREAIKDFDRALVLAPGYAAAFSNRAGAHDAAGADRPGDRRLHQGDYPGARQSCGAHRARTGASGRLSAAGVPSGISHGPSCWMPASAPATVAGRKPRSRSSATTKPSRTSAGRSPSRHAMPISTCCAGPPISTPATPHPRSRISPPRSN